MSARTLLQRPWPWLAAAALVVAVYLASLAVRVQGGDPRPPGAPTTSRSSRERKDLNVLFVLIDTLRADRLAQLRLRAPDEPDARPARRRRASASRTTSPSRPGRSARWRRCGRRSTRPHRRDALRPRAPRGGDACRPRSCSRRASAPSGIWRNGWVAPNFGFGQGFDVYDAPRSRRGSRRSVQRENPTLERAGSDEDAVDAAIEFLRVHGRERWFLYLHLMDVHEYTYDESTARLRHRATPTSTTTRSSSSTRRSTGCFGYLSASGYLENTLIVDRADHGEAFGERGFEGHARDVYRETTEVPLDPRLPVPARAGRRRRDAHRNVDVWPTLLDLLGLPALPRTRRPLARAGDPRGGARRGAPAEDGARDRPHRPAWGRPQQTPAADRRGGRGRPALRVGAQRAGSQRRALRREDRPEGEAERARAARPRSPSACASWRSSTSRAAAVWD